MIRGGRAEFLLRNAQTLSIAAFLLTCTLAFAAGADHFLSAGNWLNLLRQSAPLLIVAVAMTFVITTGGIDLSVGSIVALVNAVAAILLSNGLPWPLVVLGLLALGGGVGAAQGWFVAFQGIPSFIVTLATLSALRGLALLMTQGYSIPIPGGTSFDELGARLVPRRAAAGGNRAAGRGGGLRHARLDALRTPDHRGRRQCRGGATGGHAARRVIASAFALTGAASALAGLIIAARLGSGSSNAAVGFELDVIAAVVLGGTSLFGGRGTIIGTALGALTIAVIGNGLILLHVSPFYTQIVTGAIILAAVWLNTRVFARLAGGSRRR